MAERIPRYFGGQVPPPPPPPPPSNHGSTTSVPGQQPYAFGYNYSRGYGLPGTIPTISLCSTPKMKKNDAAANSNTRTSASHNSNTSSHGNESETTSTSSRIAENAEKECDRATTARCIEMSESGTVTNISTSWACKACNITLESEKALKAHRKSHVKCSDCSFEGSPKIVKAHYQAKHGKFSGSGFKTVTVAVPGCRVQRFKICVGNRPEDIQKWIEERKKKFPRSKDLVAKGKGNTNTTDQKATLLDSTKIAAVVAVPTEKTQEKASPNGGLSSLLAGYGSSDDDDSDTDEKEESSSAKSPRNTVEPAFGLSTDVKNGSKNKSSTTSTTEIESSDKCTPATRSPEVSNSFNDDSRTLTQQREKPKINRPCRFFSRNGSCRNGDSCRFSHDTQTKNHSRSIQNRNGNNNVRKRKRGGHISSDTLLRRLLRNDMERESTLSMQLLKFIVDKNFFLDVDDKTKGKRQRFLASKDAS